MSTKNFVFCEKIFPPVIMTFRQTIISSCYKKRYKAGMWDFFKLKTRILSYFSDNTLSIASIEVM